MKLGEVIKINQRGINKEYPHTNILYADISSVGEGVIDDLEEIILKDAPSRAKRIVLKSDTILSTVRPKNRSFYYFKEAQDNLIASTGFAVLTPIKKFINDRFLYYLISNRSFTSYLENHEKGSAYPAITTDVIENFDLELPTLETQKRIADILSAYDDLIENNLKRIKLLEQAAQNIYKEWFVNMRFPGHENVEINKETGLPEGWVRKTISETEIKMIDGDRGKNYPKSSDFYSNGYCLFLNTGNVRKSGLDFSDTKFITKEKDDELRKGKTQDKDIILTTRGTIGNVAYITENIPYKHIRINSGMLIIRVNELEIKSEYLFELLNSDEYNFKLISISSGAAQPQLPISILKHLEVVIPNIQLQKEFASNQLSLNSFISNLKNQNDKLKIARDILLPRLMNRTIEV